MFASVRSQINLLDILQGMNLVFLLFLTVFRGVTENPGIEGEPHQKYFFKLSFKMIDNSKVEIKNKIA